MWRKLIVPLKRKAQARRLRSIDGQLPTSEQKRLLCGMMYRAFLEIRILGWNGKAKQAADLADAFHNLPNFMDSPDFRWSSLHLSLRIYQERYPENTWDYLGMLENIVNIA